HWCPQHAVPPREDYGPRAEVSVCVTAPPLRDRLIFRGRDFPRTHPSDCPGTQCAVAQNVRVPLAGARGARTFASSTLVLGIIAKPTEHAAYRTGGHWPPERCS